MGLTLGWSIHGMRRSTGYPQSSLPRGRGDKLTKKLSTDYTDLFELFSKSVSIREIDGHKKIQFTTIHGINYTAVQFTVNRLVRASPSSRAAGQSARRVADERTREHVSRCRRIVLSPWPERPEKLRPADDTAFLSDNKRRF